MALVEGGAFGGGAGLACRLRHGASPRPTPKFSFSEVKLGLIAATISPYVIEADRPRATARGLFATAPAFDAAYAEKIGLTRHRERSSPTARPCTPPRDRIAAEMLACAPGAVADAKRLVDDASPAGRSTTT